MFDPHTLCEFVELFLFSERKIHVKNKQTNKPRKKKETTQKTVKGPVFWV